MEDLSHGKVSESEQNITTLSDMSIADLKEEEELDKVDFETLLEEIRASWQAVFEINTRIWGAIAPFFMGGGGGEVLLSRCENKPSKFDYKS